MPRWPAGKREKALEMLEQLRLEQQNTSSYVSSFYFAIIHAALGENDEAFRWLDKSYDELNLQMTGLRLDPLLANLRKDALFTTLINKVGL